MGLERQSVVLGGQTFSVGQLPGMRSLKMLNRLGRHLAPALAKMLAGLGALSEGANVKAEDLNGLAEGLSVFFDKLPDTELEDITKALLFDCLVDGAPLLPMFDLIMQGRADDALKLLAFALKVNYGNFIDAQLAKVAAIRARGKALKESSTSPVAGQAGA